MKTINLNLFFQNNKKIYKQINTLQLPFSMLYNQINIKKSICLSPCIMTKEEKRRGVEKSTVHLFSLINKYKKGHKQ